MTTLISLVKRNCKVFFKDKGMLISSLMTPLVLLVLYATFLANVYSDMFRSILPETISKTVINGAVGAQLATALIAVSGVTVAFCSNLLMVQDKVTNARRDLTISPVKSHILSLGYFISTAISTLLVSYSAMLLCFIYIAATGWFLNFGDVMLLIANIFLVVMFGTAMSSIIYSFLNTQGQMSAVGTIISAGYGFVCGAYMPISQFGAGLQTTMSALPFAHGTALVRNVMMNGVIRELNSQGLPSEIITVLKDTVDCNLYVNGNKIELWVMYVSLCSVIVGLIGIYVLINFLKSRAQK